MTPVMIAEDVLRATVFREIKQHIEKTRLRYKEITQMTNMERKSLFAREQQNAVEAAQERLWQVRNFQSSLPASLMRGIISDEDSMIMGKSYAHESLLLERKIADITVQIRSIAEHMDGCIVQLEGIVQLDKKNEFDRAEIVRLVKKVVVVSKDGISVEFSLEI